MNIIIRGLIWFESNNTYIQLHKIQKISIKIDNSVVYRTSNVYRNEIEFY